MLLYLPWKYETLVTLPNCFPALKDFISSKFVTQKEESVCYKLAFHVEI